MVTKIKTCLRTFLFQKAIVLYFNVVTVEIIHQILDLQNKGGKSNSIGKECFQIANQKQHCLQQVTFPTTINEVIGWFLGIFEKNNTLLTRNLTEQSHKN